MAVQIAVWSVVFWTGFAQAATVKNVSNQPVQANLGGRTLRLLPQNPVQVSQQELASPGLSALIRGGKVVVLPEQAQGKKSASKPVKSSGAKRI